MGVVITNLTNLVSNAIQSDLTDAIIKSKYENNANTNAYTDSEKAKVADTEITSQLNTRDINNRNRSNHTGTQTANTISDFDSEVANNTDVANNTAARHTHTNKTTLDLINQDLSITGTPTFTSIQLSGGTGDQGTLSWNADEETLDLVLNGSVLQVGQEMHLHVTKHGSVGTVPNGSPVIAMGTTGGSGKILVGEATLANWQIVQPGAAEIPARMVIGISTEDISNNGSITAFGKVNAIPGATYTQGAVQYVDTVNGGLTETRPTSGLVMPIAFAINSNTLMVRVTAINELDVEKGMTAYGWGDHGLIGYELASNKGIANGYASLDASGLIPAAQLPSYVDDVVEYTNLSSFPTLGTTGKIYIALDTNKAYRWSGSTYIYITSGAVDSVAGKTGVVLLDKGDVGLGNVDNTADSTKNVLSATKLTTVRTIATSGDVIGTATAFDGGSNVTISTTLSASGVAAGTYKSVTTDSKGRIIAGTNPTTVSGYGLTDVYTKTEVNSLIADLLDTTWN